MNSVALYVISRTTDRQVCEVRSRPIRWMLFLFTIDVRSAALRSTGKSERVIRIPSVDANVVQWYAVTVDTPSFSCTTSAHDPSGEE